jgi:hypothetical protein
MPKLFQLEQWRGVGSCSIMLLRQRVSYSNYTVLQGAAVNSGDFQAEVA